ncbi:phage Gp37/Gp68 family protein [Sphingobium phenoxybenzoativorans]|uniref:Phage Gp37/Gp68 family protein n=1 Tax=Sphingobium phenoxybenzoativorans TaxID=1592790 RepID=A0A975K4K6_9SPHN|nr:phage Gp37/Gp68 family protein [Sphingobium phenoxybenzoativorans]QUT04008.1 phage Gp37/Gp68 family protein [Sphingobium phenoxybenzoativorans]
MAENTKIEWATHTFNPWEGCQKVGPGCDHCYAETRNARFGGGTAVNWGPGAPRRLTSAANWRKPLAWQAEAKRTGIRPRVFCASLADVFDNAVEDMWRADLANLISDTPDLDWLLLTKRIGNAAEMLQIAFDGPTPSNVWLGATVVNQQEADRDIPKLLAVPAHKRFLSIEPMLGPIDLTSIKAPRYPDEPEDSLEIDWRFDALTTGDHYWFDGENGFPGDCGDGPYRQHRIDWVIAGGESGSGSRPSHPDWYRDLRRQCAEATIHGDEAPVPFLFKQWGEWVGYLDRDRDDPDWRRPYSDYERSVSFAFLNLAGGCGFHGERLHVMKRVGKKAAGRLLDGIEHNGVPA